ncbi:hypothetical protein E4U49_000078 [Claviceps purpurea]|nr:hypothetical protein E4U49_000078 [Claviceps purpurea]
MSDTESTKTKTNFILYLAAGSPQGNSIIGELKSQSAEHEVRYIDLTKNEHREPWFLEISPFGIIPALTETVHGEDVAVFGTASILRHLHNGLWLKTEPSSMRYHWEAVNWTCWILHRPGLIQALAYDLRRHVPDSMPSEAPPADFLRCQMLDLYEYFNEYQADHEEPYIAGDEPSIADVAALEWISCHALIGLSLEKDPAVRTWYDESRDEDIIPFALDCTRVPSPGTLILF